MINMIIDIDKYTDLKDVFLEHYSRFENRNQIWESMKSFLNEHLNSTIFVSAVYLDGEVVSMAMMMHYIYPPNELTYNNNGDCGLVLNVHTLEKYRGLGYASQCVNELIYLAKEKNFNYLYLNARRPNNMLYLNLGFSFDSENDFMELYLK